MFKLLASVAALAAATAGPAAMAQPTALSLEVRYDDLNLESAAGQARLEARIDRAVRSVCSITSGRQTLSQRAAERTCARDARNKAAVEVATLISPDTRLGG